MAVVYVHEGSSKTGGDAVDDDKGQTVHRESSFSQSVRAGLEEYVVQRKGWG